MNTRHYKPTPVEKPLVLNEPAVVYEIKTSNMSFEEDFNRALATAISIDEFSKRMDERIDAWPWKEKLSSPMK